MRGWLRTCAWFVAMLLLFEMLCWVVFERSPLRDSKLAEYMHYGYSSEVKLRKLVHRTDLPPNHILYVGWLNEEQLASNPARADLTIYGMSFSQQVGDAISRLRPQMSMGWVLGPGAPLNHTYAMHQVERKHHKTRAALVGLLSSGVSEVLVMNRSSLYLDQEWTNFFPRYAFVNGHIQEVGESLINSHEDLKRFLDTPELWSKQLDIMDSHDDAFHRHLFQGDLGDQSAIARLLRRAYSKRASARYAEAVHDQHGYNLKHEATTVYRELFRELVRELRADGAYPVAILFSQQGYANHLEDLMRDVIAEERVPYVNSVDSCPPVPASFVADGHFTPECSEKIARAALELVDVGLARP